MGGSDFLELLQICQKLHFCDIRDEINFRFLTDTEKKSFETLIETPDRNHSSLINRPF